MSRVDPSGLSRILSYIKSWVTSALSSKANNSHSHTKSQITDFPSIPSKTSDLTNDSGFLTSHQSLSGYVPTSVGAVITGSSIARTTDTGNLNICGGTSYENGAFIALRGKNSTITDQKGVAIISANNGSSSCSLELSPSGIATLGGG